MRKPQPIHTPLMISKITYNLYVVRMYSISLIPARTLVAQARMRVHVRAKREYHIPTANLTTVSGELLKILISNLTKLWKNKRKSRLKTLKPATMMWSNTIFSVS